MSLANHQAAVIINNVKEFSDVYELNLRELNLFLYLLELAQIVRRHK